MKRKIGVVAAAATALVVLAGCATTPAADEGGKDITLWVMGGDTPDALRDYPKTEYADATGGTLTIEQQDWADALSKLTTALPDPENTPDVTEIGNTWSPTFTSVGAFSDISDMYDELGGSDLLQSFVEVGAVDGKNYAMPYYFGSRYIFYRKDIWDAAGLPVPATLDEFNESVAALKTAGQSGFYIGGEDWRNGISWIFANGGDLAKKDGDTWKSSLSDPNTIKGLEQLQALFADASLAPVTEAAAQGAITRAEFRQLLMPEMRDRQWFRLMMSLLIASDEDPSIRPWLQSFHQHVEERLAAAFAAVGVAVTADQLHSLHATFFGLLFHDMHFQTDESFARVIRAASLALDGVLAASDVAAPDATPMNLVPNLLQQ